MGSQAVSRRVDNIVRHVVGREGGGVTLLVGSCIVDIQAEAPGFRTDSASQASSIGRIRHSIGGVCSNIARALRALGQDNVHLVSAVGSDGSGRELMEECSRIGLCTRGILTVKDHRTATVVCLLNSAGEVVYSLADVSILESGLTPAVALHCMDCCEYGGGVVVVDGDLSSEVIKVVCERARTKSCIVIFDPATAGKATRVLSALPYIDYLTPNVEELNEIASQLASPREKIQPKSWQEFGSIPLIFLDSLQVVEAILERGTQHVILTAGGDGASIYFRKRSKIRVIYCPVVAGAKIASVNGAGDCLVAGFIRALSLGLRIEDALAMGSACAWEALHTKNNVPESFNDAKLFEKVEQLRILVQSFDV
jgi:sugar/nucleoside kinase (ribokinase family)